MRCLRPRSSAGRSGPLRPQARRPQLKRGPLGGANYDDTHSGFYQPRSTSPSSPLSNGSGRNSSEKKRYAPQSVLDETRARPTFGAQRPVDFGWHSLAIRPGRVRLGQMLAEDLPISMRSTSIQTTPARRGTALVRAVCEWTRRSAIRDHTHDV